jgi:hypothetical protein
MHSFLRIVLSGLVGETFGPHPKLNNRRQGICQVSQGGTMKQLLLSVLLFFTIATLSAQFREGIVLHPNPIEDRADLMFDQPLTESITITVKDLTGKTVYLLNPDTSGEQCSQVTLDFESLRRGIYIVQIVSQSGKIKTIKFQKN